MAKQDDPRAKKEYWRGRDADGEPVNLGRNYKDYRKAEKLRKQVITGNCPHPWVMVTERCQSCGKIHVWISEKKGGKLKLCRLIG